MQDQAVIPGVQTVMLARVRVDRALQLRFAMNLDRVEEFKRAMLDGARFPPIVVFYDGAEVWLADGFHRVAACGRARVDMIEADVREGTWRDALAFAFFANAIHGEPLSPRERRTALPRIVEEFPDESTRQLAARIGISNARVSQIRQALAGVKNLTPEPSPRPPDTEDDDPLSPEEEERVQRHLLAMDTDHEMKTDSVQTILDAAGDDDGSWERARQLAYYSRRVAMASELVLLEPDAVAGLLDEGRRVTARSFCTAMIAWCQGLEGAMNAPIHLVPRRAEHG